jgi:hypothetical protein
MPPSNDPTQRILDRIKANRERYRRDAELLEQRGDEDRFDDPPGLSDDLKDLMEKERLETKRKREPIIRKLEEEGKIVKPLTKEQSDFIKANQQRNLEIEKLRSEFDAGSLSTPESNIGLTMDIMKDIDENIVKKSFSQINQDLVNKLKEFPVTAPIVDAIEKLEMNNITFGEKTDEQRKIFLEEKVKENKEKNISVPYYEQELEKLTSKVDKPTYRKVGEDLMSVVQLGISLIPKVMLLNLASEPAMKLGGDLGEQIGGQTGKDIGETVGHLGLASTLGLPVLIGSLTSMGATEVADKLTKGTPLDAADKKLIVEAAGHIGFLAGMFSAKPLSAGAKKLFNKSYHKFYESYNGYAPGDLFHKGGKTKLTPEGIEHFKRRATDPGSSPAEKELAINLLKKNGVKDFEAPPPVPKERGIQIGEKEVGPKSQIETVKEPIKKPSITVEKGTKQREQQKVKREPGTQLGRDLQKGVKRIREKEPKVDVFGKVKKQMKELGKKVLKPKPKKIPEKSVTGIREEFFAEAKELTKDRARKEREVINLAKVHGGVTYTKPAEKNLREMLLTLSGDTRQVGKWKLAWFDDKGAIDDRTFDTLEEAAAEFSRNILKKDLGFEVLKTPERKIITPPPVGQKVEGYLKGEGNKLGSLNPAADVETVIKTWVDIRQGRHKAFDLRSDRIGNSESVLRRFANDHPERSLELANSIKDMSAAEFEKITAGDIHPDYQKFLVNNLTPPKELKKSTEKPLKKKGKKPVKPKKVKKKKAQITGTKKQRIVDTKLEDITVRPEDFQGRDEPFSQDSFKKVVTGRIQSAIEEGEISEKSAANIIAAANKFLKEKHPGAKELSVEDLTPENTFSWGKFGQIGLWKDPSSGNLVVTSGHSRLAASQFLSEHFDEFKDVPTQVAEKITFEEAKQEALTSNVLGTQEKVTSHAERYRKLREQGKKMSDIIKAAKAFHGRNSNNIINLSFLSREGDMNTQLKQHPDQSEIVKAADWIGEARRSFSQLTDAHENELYRWLIKDNAIFTKVKSKIQLNDTIYKKVTHKSWDPDQPLNLKNVITRSKLMDEFEADVAEAEKLFEEAKSDLFKERGKALKRGVAEADLLKDKKVKFAQDMVDRLQKELVDLKAKRSDVLEQESRQESLFAAKTPPYKVDPLKPPVEYANFTVSTYQPIREGEKPTPYLVTVNEDWLFQDKVMKRVNDHMKALGYDYRGVEDTKRAVAGFLKRRNGSIYHEDLVPGILKVGGVDIEQPEAPKDKYPISDNEIIDDAVNIFGITESPFLAGYMMPDGQLLDFSGGQGQRYLDHREVNATGDKEQNTSGEDYDIGMEEFQQLGNIRMMFHHYEAKKEMFLDMEVKPTASQWKKIDEIVDQENVAMIRLDLNQEISITSRRKFTDEYDMKDPEDIDRLDSDVKKFYRGELPRVRGQSSFSAKSIKSEIEKAKLLLDDLKANVFSSPQEIAAAEKDLRELEALDAQGTLDVEAAEAKMIKKAPKPPAKTKLEVQFDKLLSKGSVDELKDYKRILTTGGSVAKEFEGKQEQMVRQIDQRINYLETDQGKGSDLFKEASDEQQQSLFSVEGKKRMQKQTDTQEFKDWFGRSAVVDDNGAPLVVYSGHSNTPLYGNFDPKKATAGGFYASENPEIASNYALGKFGVFEYYNDGSAYRIKGKGGKYNKKLWQIELSEKQRKILDEIAEEQTEFDEPRFNINEMMRWAEQSSGYEPLARRILARGKYDLQVIWEYNERMGYNIAYPTQQTEAREPLFMRQIKNDTEEIMDRLGLDWNAYDWNQPGVFPVYLRIENPIVAAEPFPEDLLAALKERAKGERHVPIDQLQTWTKDYPLRNWIADIESGGEGWTTQIPRKALPIIKEFGYDGIKELGMKGIKDPDYQRQTNWIAFDNYQIKSAIANKGTFDPSKKEMSFSIEKDDAGKAVHQDIQPAREYHLDNPHFLPNHPRRLLQKPEKNL